MIEMIRRAVPQPRARSSSWSKAAGGARAVGSNRYPGPAGDLRCTGGAGHAALVRPRGFRTDARDTRTVAGVASMEVGDP
jgi:hypothetical protein